MTYALGIDLGGTKIEGVVLRDGAILVKERDPTMANLGYAAIINNVHVMYEKLRSSIDGASHTVGIGSPGTVVPQTGFLRNCNIKVMNGMPLKCDLEAALAHPLTLENDANCFVTAEGAVGERAGGKTIFGAVLGTGCGAGMLVNGELHVGKCGLAGEWGHMSIAKNGWPCYCGRRGCVERYISGGGLEDIFENMTSRRRSLGTIMANYRAGGNAETVLIKQFIGDLSLALANVVMVLDPDLIILGGGVAKIEEIFDYLPERLGAITQRGNLVVPIVKPSWGDSAGSVGAALIGARSADRRNSFLRVEVAS